MAEAVGSALGTKRFTFMSAGVRPEPVDPQTMRVLGEKGVDVSAQPSRAVGDVPGLDQVQVVVSLGLGLERVIPQRPAKKTVGLDWNLENPATVSGAPDDVRRAYERAWEALTLHVRDLVEAILGKDAEEQHAESRSS
jgi:protein-tyrosine-phosphatase